MQRIYCDTCGREIKHGELKGGFIKLVKTFQSFPMMPGKESIMPKETVIPEEYELCEDCQKWTWAKLEERKKEFDDKKK